MQMPSTAAEDQGISTAEVARLAGVHRDTLLRWLRKGLVPEPQRDRNGWRSFSATDAQAVITFARSAPDAGEGASRADERPYLPRAFSVLRAPAGSDELHFLIEDVGPGTARLCELGPADELMLVGPLGIGFAPPREGRQPLLV